MNIEEYRALRAQEAQAPQEQQQVEAQAAVPEVQTEQTAPVTGEIEAETATPETPPTLDHVEIDGKQVPLDELKNGYLRQSDYTSKTQQLAKEKERLKLAEEYYAAVNSNPDFAKDLANSFNLPYKTPEQLQYEELNMKYHETLLNQEISELKNRYSDFDEVAVVNAAAEKGITSLEDAYHLIKAKQPERGAELDIAALTEQIRQSVLKDLQSQVDTSTIISAGGDTASITQTEPTLTAQEQKVARGLKLTDEEYLKAKKRR